MSIKINARVSRVEPSMTLALTARAKSMTAEGIDVVGFAAGEPDFDTPEVIRERAKDAIDEGATRYTPSSGTPELRKAICAKLKRENKLEYSPDQVIVSCGAKHTLYNIFMTMLEEGDEVLLPAPYWLSYPEQIALAGGKTVVIPATSESEYKITPEQLEQAITPKTVAFLINSPGNPTGALYTPEEITALAKVLEQHPGITIISDEIYERLIYGGGRHLSFAAATPAMYERTLTVNGMSKTYAMTGWRIGYCAGPKDFIGAMGKMQSHSTSNATSFCQAASVTALEKGESDILRMRAAFDERRRDMVAKLNSIPGIVCPEPLGAFYAFPDVSALYAKAGVKGSIDFCEKLLDEARVVCVPGMPFGDDAAIRLSYATSPERIGEGLRRIEDFVKKLG
jgi:aspartate aminotransferase